MKLSTINQVVQAIVDEADKTNQLTHKVQFTRIANEATIYFKTALFCEDRGIDEAMKYFWGTHTEDEYKEWLTSVTKGEDDA